MTQWPCSSRGKSLNGVLDLVDIAVYGPMSSQAHGGFEYFITFTDDYSKFGYIYLIQHKFETQYKAKVKCQTSEHIKVLQFGRGGAYLFGEIKDYLTQKGIVFLLIAPGTPQQNSVAERRNGTLFDMVRSMMSHATLPISFIGYPLDRTTHVLNQVCSESLPKTLWEMWKR